MGRELHFLVIRRQSLKATTREICLLALRFRAKLFLGGPTKKRSERSMGGTSWLLRTPSPRTATSSLGRHSSSFWACRRRSPTPILTQHFSCLHSGASCRAGVVWYCRKIDLRCSVDKVAEGVQKREGPFASAAKDMLGPLPNPAAAEFCSKLGALSRKSR